MTAHPDFPTELSRQDLNRISERYRRLHVPVESDPELDFLIALPSTWTTVSDPQRLIPEGRSDLALAAWDDGHGIRTIVSVHYAQRELNSVDWIESELMAEGCEVLKRRTFDFVSGPVSDHLVYRCDGGMVARIIVVRNGGHIFRVEVMTTPEQWNALSADAFYVLISFGLIHPRDNDQVESRHSYSMGTGSIVSFDCPGSWTPESRADQGSASGLTLVNRYAGKTRVAMMVCCVSAGGNGPLQLPLLLRSMKLTIPDERAVSDEVADGRPDTEGQPQYAMYDGRPCHYCVVRKIRLRNRLFVIVRLNPPGAANRLWQSIAVTAENIVISSLRM